MIKMIMIRENRLRIFCMRCSLPGDFESVQNRIAHPTTPLLFASSCPWKMFNISKNWQKTKKTLLGLILFWPGGFRFRIIPIIVSKLLNKVQNFQIILTHQLHGWPLSKDTHHSWPFLTALLIFGAFDVLDERLLAGAPLIHYYLRAGPFYFIWHLRSPQRLEFK